MSVETKDEHFCALFLFILMMYSIFCEEGSNVWLWIIEHLLMHE
jgi:hypothetical protein